MSFLFAALFLAAAFLCIELLLYTEFMVHVLFLLTTFSPVQCPVNNKTFSMQQLMAIKAQQDEKPNIAFDPISFSTARPISTVDAFASNSNSYIVQNPQNSFGEGTHGVRQFALHSIQSQDSAPISQNTIPIGTSSSFSQAQSSSNGHRLTATFDINGSFIGTGFGCLLPRNVVKPSPTTAQLTIFYAGSVNVYDEVPWDKAQAVMFKASEGIKANSANVMPSSVAESIALPLTKEPLSVSSYKGNQTESGSMMPTEGINYISNRSATPVLTSQDNPIKTLNASMVAATAATILSRAVPQARKASLTRFLEKRKERVSSVMPYTYDKKQSDIVPEVAASSCNGSVSQSIPSSKQEYSWLKGQAKHCEDNGDSAATKLEM